MISVLRGGGVQSLRFNDSGFSVVWNQQLPPAFIVAFCFLFRSLWRCCSDFSVFVCTFLACCEQSTWASCGTARSCLRWDDRIRQACKLQWKQIFCRLPEWNISGCDLHLSMKLMVSRLNWYSSFTSKAESHHILPMLEIMRWERSVWKSGMNSLTDHVVLCRKDHDAVVSLRVFNCSTIIFFHIRSENYLKHYCGCC